MKEKGRTKETRDEFTSIVFAGGGSRCMWQAGFVEELRERIELKPVRIASVSAGAAVACLLRDAGMEVLYLGRFNLPPTIVKVCMEEDVDVVGLSCHSWEYLYYLPNLLELMKERSVDIPVVVVSSVITPGDSRRLADMGIAAVFGPGVPDEQIIESIRRIA